MYNNLSENFFFGNFFYLIILCVFYLSDNDFEILLLDIGKFIKLQIFSFRDNDLILLFKEIGEFIQFKEFYIQGNCFIVLFLELGNLDLIGQKQVFKVENNFWVIFIVDQFQFGVFYVFEYICFEIYKYFYGRYMQVNLELLKKNNDKLKKISWKFLVVKNR